ncbi:unnamed protein product [Ambrosiozyma monospora]|uniref:Unnamed protein product n=1 Tax=Ambrosiozyma monospora TaxID=43982 RepID=A0ACB5UAL6_AMBMO|nr:unnamed protein product [Ambrosiozyma monospora]
MELEEATLIHLLFLFSVTQYLLLPNENPGVEMNRESVRPENHYVKLLKPMKFVFAGDLTALLNPILRAKYGEYLETMDYSLFDKYHLHTYPGFPSREMLISGYTSKVYSSSNLTSCLLSELSTLIARFYLKCVSYLKDQLGSFIPGKLEINNLKPGCRITKDGSTILLISFESVSIEHVFDEGYLYSTRTQDMLLRIRLPFSLPKAGIAYWFSEPLLYLVSENKHDVETVTLTRPRCKLVTFYP